MDDCFFDLDGDGVEEFGVVVKALGDDGENMVPEVNYFIQAVALASRVLSWTNELLYVTNDHCNSIQKLGTRIHILQVLSVHVVDVGKLYAVHVSLLLGRVILLQDFSHLP